jgi:hypothetical protein
MPLSDLCTLAQVKAWLPNPAASSDDAMLNGLISQASMEILSDLQRQPVYAQTITDIYDGWGRGRLMLRRYPVLSVTSVVLNNITTITPVSQAQNFTGWQLQPWDGFLPGRPQLLVVKGWSYGYGYGGSANYLNVAVTYTVGYQAQNEAATVPASGPTLVTCQQVNGPLVQDNGVKYAATGVALTAQLPGTTLVAGQYIPPLINAPNAGQYQFATADAGAGVLITYSYVPTPLNQAAIEVVGEAYRYRQRIGTRSQTVPGPMSTTFDLSRFTAAVKWMTQPYRQVVPVQ